MKPVWSAGTSATSSSTSLSATRTTMYSTTPSASLGVHDTPMPSLVSVTVRLNGAGFTAAGAGGAGVAIVGTNVTGAAAVRPGAVATGSAGGSVSCTTGAGRGAGGAGRA